MIRTIVIDDEDKARETIVNMLSMYCKDVEVVAEAHDVQSGYDTIRKHAPELVLLDIKMPDGTGFDLLRKFLNFDFQVIFITAYEEFAIRAFKFSALDYLLKPIDPDELVGAVQKAQAKLKSDNLTVKIQTLFENIDHLSNREKKIVLKTSSNVHVVNLYEIIRCQSDKNYTHFYTTDGEKIVVSKTLKEYDELLRTYGFFRVHQSHLINLTFVKRFEKSDGGYLVMKDNSKVPVSFRKKDDLMKLFKSL
jgi:two-component system LytT family response regulator